MNDNQKLQAEYHKGYRAGLRRKVRELSAEEQRRRENAFWQRAFIAAIPATMQVLGWKRGTADISGLTDRMVLASEAADEALKLARRRL